MQPKKFLTTAEILELYGIDETAIQSLVDAGELKALADRGTWKYRREEIETLISSGRLHSSHELPAVDDVDFDETLGFQAESAGNDFTDFLELDEDALSGQSTVISTGPLPDMSDLKLSFDETPEQSSSDVQVVQPSDSDVSDSDIRLLSSSSGEVPELSSSDVKVWTPEDAISSSDVTIFNPDQAADAGQTEEIPVAEDMGATLRDFDVIGQGADEGSSSDVTVTLPTDLVDQTSVADSFDSEPTEVIPMVRDEELATEALSFEAEDSGLTLDVGDSGLTLASPESEWNFDEGDSGLTLDTGDSGLTLDTGDSGLTLELVDDSDAGPAPVDGTQRMQQPLADDVDLLLDDDDSEATSRLPVSEQFAEELAFTDDDEPAPTAVFVTDDSESSYPASLSAAIDAGEEVDDLELTDDLEEAAVLEDEDAFAAEDEVLDADEDAFSDEFSGEMAAEDDDEFLTPAAKSVTPREPSWGVFPAILVIGASVLVGLNGWLMWEGLTTMWNGSEPSSAASSLISTIAGMLG